MVGCNGSLRVGADTGNFSIRLETSNVVKNRLKSALVAEISRIKVPKKGNLLSLPFALFHIALPEVSEVRSPRDEIGCTRSVAWGGSLWALFRFKERNARIVVIPGFDASHSNSRPIIIAR